MKNASIQSNADYLALSVLFCVCSFTESLGEDAFSANLLKSSDNGRVHAWTQVLDRHDGSYIVRYKMMQSYENLKIEVLYNGAHVANSPYFLEGS